MSFFSNKVVWITGASSGIGEALVNSLARQGSKIILSARKTDELQRVRTQAGLNDTNSLILPLDLGDSAAFPSLTDTAVARFGRIDILVNNGGISQRSYAEDTPLSIDRQIMEVNYFGQVALTKSVLPFMIRQKSGHIVVISSVSGKFGFFLRSAYSASKHALHGFFDSLRMEVHRHNINVLLVCPGKVKTNISVNALKADGRTHGVMDESQEKGISAQACAEKIISAIQHGREEIYAGQRKERTALWMKRFFPRLFSKIIRKQKPE